MAAVIKRKPLSRPELSAFCEQMALILKSGIFLRKGRDDLHGYQPSAALQRGPDHQGNRPPVCQQSGYAFQKAVTELKHFRDIVNQPF